MPLTSLSSMNPAATSAGLEGPSLMVHTLISSISAIVMLLLAMSLRAQAHARRPMMRAPVAEARPVLQAYGVVPTADTAEMRAAEEPSAPNEAVAASVELQMLPPVAVGHRLSSAAEEATVVGHAEPVYREAGASV